MELKKGYKQTEFGDIPEDWGVKSIDSITIDMLQGVNTAIDIPEYVKDGVPMLKANNIIDGTVNFSTSDHISHKTYLNYSDRFKLRKFDFLFSNIGARLGTGSLLKVETNCTFAWNVMRITPNQKVINPSFLEQIMNSKIMNNQIMNNISGSGMGFVPKNVLEKLKIPLPSNISEQTAIANALSDMDALISQTEKLFEKKRAIKQGAMQELLKPREGWVTKKLGDIGKTYGGLSGKSKVDFANGNAFYIPFMNVMSSPTINLNFFDSVYIRSGEKQNKAQIADLFFNGSSETPEEVGMCSVLTKQIDNLYLNSFCFGYRLNDAQTYNGLFLAYYFRSDFGRAAIFSLAQGATRYNLSKGNFLKMVIPIPELQIQNEIAGCIADMDSELKKITFKLTKLKQQKQGMMQALLTGKIRLVS